MSKKKWKQIQVVEGWIEQEEQITACLTVNKKRGVMFNPWVFDLKGKPKDWDEWPPQKVRITVEVEE